MNFKNSEFVALAFAFRTLVLLSLMEPFLHFGLFGAIKSGNKKYNKKYEQVEEQRNVGSFVMNVKKLSFFGGLGAVVTLAFSSAALAEETKVEKAPETTHTEIGVDSKSGVVSKAEQEGTTKEVKGPVQLTTVQKIAAIDIPWEEQRGKGLSLEGTKTIAKMDSMQAGGLVMVYYANGDESEGIEGWEKGYDPEDATVYAEAKAAMQQLKYKGIEVDKITLTDSFDGKDNIEVYYKGARLFTQPSVIPVRGTLTDLLIEATEENLETFEKWQQGQVSGVSADNTLTLASN